VKRTPDFFDHKGHKGHEENSKELRHCEELRLFCESKTNGDEAIHFLQTSNFDDASHRFFSGLLDPDIRRDDGGSHVS
jgi:hypothetical protein